MNPLARFLTRMGLKDCETDPKSDAVVALANAEAEYLEEMYSAVRRVLSERGLS